MTNETEKSGVEWLEQEMLKPNLSMKEILEKAKQIEKEQKYKFADEYCNALYSGCSLTPEDYDLTYGGNK
jgi:hypothetical protein